MRVAQRARPSMRLADLPAGMSPGGEGCIPASVNSPPLTSGQLQKAAAGFADDTECVFWRARGAAAGSMLDPHHPADPDTL